MQGLYLADKSLKKYIRLSKDCISSHRQLKKKPSKYAIVVCEQWNFFFCYVVGGKNWNPENDDENESDTGNTGMYQGK